ncbi:MAG: ABC transporter permease [Bacteroidetes bacterium]|nr:ABC transporter permease [Bacteroidota bacterium]
MKNFQPLHLVFAFLGGLILLFIIAPLVGMVLHTTPSELIETSGDHEVLGSIWLTILTSMAATVLFAFASIPLAYLLARKQFIFKRLVLGIINLPVVIPHSAAGIAILGFIARDTVVGKIAGQFGLNFIGHPAGIALAMAFVSVPFLLNAARDGFLSVPERLEKAALSLGASQTRVFFTVSLPLAWRHIVSGLIMMFARGMSEFGAVVIIAYHPMITPVLIYERFSAFGLKYARPVSVIFIAVCLVFFIALRMLSREKKNA